MLEKERVGPTASNEVSRGWAVQTAMNAWENGSE